MSEPSRYRITPSHSLLCIPIFILREAHINSFIQLELAVVSATKRTLTLVDSNLC